MPPPFFYSANYPLIGEALIVGVEAVILNRVAGLSAKRAAVYSLRMNAVLFCLGLVLL